MAGQNESPSAREALRRLVHKSFVHIRGKEPTDAEVMALVEAEESARRKELGVTNANDGAKTGAPVASGRVEATPAIRTAQTWLDEDELKEAESVRWYARTNRVPSVLDAVKWYVLHMPEAVSAPTLRDCIKEFLVIKQCEGVRQSSVYAYRSNLGVFAASFGDRQPVTITPKEMSDYLMRWENHATRRHKWQTLATFFAWLIRMRYALENPVVLGMQSLRIPSPERFILTPAEARDILHRAKHTDAIGYWVLSMFAGMRTSEIKAVRHLPNPWSVVRLGPGVIDLPDAITKTGARIVPISPVLRRWLHWMKAHGVPFIPAGLQHKTHLVRCQALAKRIQLVPPTLTARGVDMRMFNLGRRACISCRMALPGVSFAEVSVEVGNTEEIMRKHYFRRVSRRDAVKYFNLTPDRV